MNILVTGASGFLGRNLTENLKNLRDGKNTERPGIFVREIYEYYHGSPAGELDRFCADCDFVFHLAGVNRPEDVKEFETGNTGFTAVLLDSLKRQGNRCPVMLASSIQAALTGRFAGSKYGLSKRESEELLFRYAEETGAKVFVYRFPNLAGKWVRPDYNSAVGTFCHHIANDLPVRVDDPGTELELLFAEDLIEELFDALEGHPHRADYPRCGETAGGILYDGLTPRPAENGRFCYVPVTHRAKLGYILQCLKSFHDQPGTLVMPALIPGSFEKKLFSMYLSYLPREKTLYDLPMKTDERGSFTEFLKTADHGQFSVNITKPGVTKGLHWHNTKWEIFLVVSGRALIRERQIGTDPETGSPYEPMEFEVSGEKLQAVYMLPGYTHSITNLSATEDLVTLMWANEVFDPQRPDTYRE